MGMDPALIIALISIVLSVIFGVASTRTSWLSVKAAERSALSAEKSQETSARQLASTLDAQAAALQPYVWVDLRPRDDGSMLVLVVGNAGPTVATNVRVTFEPPLSSVVPTEEREDAERLEHHLAAGLRSVTPKRTFAWNLGMAHAYFPDDSKVPDVHIRVTGEGPRGPLEPLEYALAMEDLKYQSARAHGVSVLEQPLKKIQEAVARLAR